MTAMLLLLTRPEEDSRRLAALLQEQGHECLTDPLMRIEPIDAPPLGLDGVQAILATSSNGVRALARRDEFDRARAIALLAVGDSTARAATEAGFERVLSADGDVEELIGLAAAKLDPAAGRLVHVSGHDRAGDLKGGLETLGYDVETAVLYRAVAAEALAKPTVAAFRQGALGGVLLYSPRTARIYCGLVARARLARQAADVLHYCLSKAVQAAVSGELREAPCLVATRPTQESMLALVG